MNNAVIAVHNPTNQPLKQAVIWLHGLGANGHDFEPIVPELGLSDGLAVKFVFPHAPSIPVTVNGGYVMPAWYDIYEMSLNRKIDSEQIMASAQRVHDIIKSLNEEGIESKNIVIAGFSQGGAVAYQAALTYSEPLAGLLTLSTYFATKESIDITASQSLPIMIMHGTYDDVVPSVLGVQAKETLDKLGFNPDHKTYAMAHQVCMEQIRDIGSWLNRQLTDSFIKE